MFLLNYEPIVTKTNLGQFTIQNVPIKFYEVFAYKREELKFTIQNVPIK